MTKISRIASRFIFPLLSLVFLFSTGAAFIDNETKQGVLNTNDKINHLLEQEKRHHEEMMKVLKEIAAKKTTVQVMAPAVKSESKPETKAPAAALIPVATPLPAPVALPQPAVAAADPLPKIEAPKILSAPMPAVVTADNKASPQTAAIKVPTTPTLPQALPPVLSTATPVVKLDVAKPVTLQPAPAVAPQATPSSVSVAKTSVPQPNITVVMPPELTSRVRFAESSSLIALFLSGISLVVLVILTVSIRKNEQKIRKAIWKSEVDSLRTDVMGSRPQLKVEKSYDRLTLANIGTLMADDIRLFVGPAPATMKQKLNISARINAGEKVDVDISSHFFNGQLYGTVEYKNPQNGRLYKDQFVLKIDGVTGELFPIQQVS